MDIRTAVLGISAVIAGAGVSLLAVAWATGSVAWLFADLPGADNDLMRELSVGALGVVFVIVAVVGAGLARAAGAQRVPAGASVVAGALAAASFLTAVVGAGQYAAQAAAAAVAPALDDDAALLNASGGDGRIVVGVALVLAVAALAVPLVVRSRERVAPSGKVPAGR